MQLGKYPTMTRTEKACRLLEACGAMAVKAWLLRAGGSPRLRILAYHRVLPDAADASVFDREVVSCTAREFEREMRYVRQFFNVISFADLEDANAHFRNPLIVTFDDGYKDNHDVVLPILRDLGMKATFFVTTGLIGPGELPWWDEITALVQRCTADHLSLAPWVVNALPVESEGEKASAVSDLLRAAKSVSNDDRLSLIEALQDQCGPLPEGLAGGVMMDWDDVRDLADSGMELGSHTVSHPVLGRLSDPSVLACEMEDSKRKLEAETERPVIALSYPVGSQQAAPDAVVNAARKAGYRYACTYTHGTNRRIGFDSFRLPRIKTETGEDFRRFRAKVLFPDVVRY